MTVEYSSFQFLLYQNSRILNGGQDKPRRVGFIYCQTMTRSRNDTKLNYD